MVALTYTGDLCLLSRVSLAFSNSALTCVTGLVQMFVNALLFLMNHRYPKLMTRNEHELPGGLTLQGTPLTRVYSETQARFFKAMKSNVAEVIFVLP